MPPVTDLQFLTSAAEQAASAGDFVSAEQQLRLAVEVQEENIGPMHPDLANTLNNLGVIYERLERPVDAERCYRRAFAIASAVLDPHHPFLTLSATNLRGFCLARGIPFEPASSSPAIAKPDAAAAETEDRFAAGADTRFASGPEFSHATDAAEPMSTVTPSTKPGNFWLVAAAVGALSLIAIVLVATRLRTNGEADAPTAQELRGTEAPRAQAPPPSETAAPRAQVPPDGGPEAPPPQPKDAASTSAADPVIAGKPAAQNAPAVAGDAPGAPLSELRLVSADLCRSLETRGRWRCTPADAVQRPGQLFFYTRVASPVDATIEHRWYREDRLVRTVPLRVRANPREGFRTYSRTTVTADRAGAWRVELRNPDGDILQEARVTVSP